MKSPWTAIVGLVIVLMAAYAADRLGQLLHEEAARSQQFGAWLWISGLANLVVAGLLIGVSGLLRKLEPRPRWVGGLYALLGLFLVFALAGRYTLAGGFFPLGLAVSLTSESRLAMGAAYCAVLGLAALLPSRQVDRPTA